MLFCDLWCNGGINNKCYCKSYINSSSTAMFTPRIPSHRRIFCLHSEEFSSLISLFQYYKHTTLSQCGQYLQCLSVYFLQWQVLIKKKAVLLCLFSKGAKATTIITTNITSLYCSPLQQPQVTKVLYRVWTLKTQNKTGPNINKKKKEELTN